MIAEHSVLMIVMVTISILVIIFISVYFDWYRGYLLSHYLEQKFGGEVTQSSLKLFGMPILLKYSLIGCRWNLVSFSNIGVMRNEIYICFQQKLLDNENWTFGKRLSENLNLEYELRKKIGDVNKIITQDRKFIGAVQENNELYLFFEVGFNGNRRLDEIFELMNNEVFV